MIENIEEFQHKTVFLSIYSDSTGSEADENPWFEKLRFVTW